MINFHRSRPSMRSRAGHSSDRFSPSGAEAWLYGLVPSKIKPIENQITRPLPLLGISMGFGLFFGILIIRLLTIQLINGQRFVVAAEGNRLRDEVVYAPRGNIYDRKGRVLAHNRPDYQLSATPYLLPKDGAKRNAVYEAVSEILSLKSDEIRIRAEASGLNYTLPVLLAEHLDQNQMLKIEQILPNLEGLSVDVIPVREYVRDTGLAQVLGFVGRVSTSDLKFRNDVLPTDLVGRGGIEQQYDSILRGQNGRTRTEVDAYGRPMRLLAREQAKSGQDITLTIDLDLQKKLFEELSAQLAASHTSRGSALMMDPRNGNVLAMVSLPTYDNNLFSAGVTQSQFQQFINDSNQPLLNKAIAASYPSGSTIKPLIASAALQEGVVSDQTVINDTGAIAIHSQYDPSVTYTFHGWRPGGLGPMTLRRALAMSSNIYFYTVGGGYQNQSGLGIERLSRYLRLFEWGQKTGIDLPGETKGRVPDPAWKKAATGEDWYLGDTYNLSIGQGELKVSPLQLSVAISAIANGGHLYSPHLLGQSDAKLIRDLPIKQENLQIVREGMHEMVYKGAYCACRFASIPVEIAGKTGTAETDKVDPNIQPHAWFTAYGPWQQPEVLVTIMLEQGDKSAYALNPAINVLSYYFQTPR